MGTGGEEILMSEAVTFRVKRYDPDQNKSEYVSYEIPLIKGMTILEGLWHIVDYIDGSLAFRYSCRGAVCGSCAMLINGVIDLSCHTQIADIHPETVTIEPLPYFKVLRDLVVDMEPFMDKLEAVKPYFQKLKAHDRELLQSPEDRKKISKTIDCILCAACNSSCPLAAMNDDYLGPAALTAASRFAFDSRNPEGPDRLLKLNGLGEFDGCMRIARCTKVCPKYIVPDERIDEVRDYVANHPSKQNVETKKTTCGYCSTGCGLSVDVKGTEPISLKTTQTTPVNKGRACPKGWSALAPMSSEDRATTPLVRNDQGKLESVDWDTALQAFTKNFKAIQDKHGKESVAFISTGQMLTEEMALSGCLTKFGMGILHTDGNTRQCMASAVVAYKQAFGFDAPPYTYQDFEETDLAIFVGANSFISHPIMWERLMLNKKNPHIIVIDPRRTDTARQAHDHLQIKPKSDQALFYGVARILIQNDWLDKTFIEKNTNNFDEFKAHVQTYTLDKASQDTGLPKEKIRELAELIHTKKNVSFWWTMGINQSFVGVRSAQAMINICLMTGNIGRPGTGPNSITGQCNAMGSRIFSNTTSLMAGYDFTNADHRKTFSKILNIDPALIPDKNPLPYFKIIEGIRSGDIKGLWIVATNPAHSWINQNDFQELMGKLDYLVVQDMYDSTETAQMADLVLPAGGWGEKEGTFINSERRITVLRKLTNPPGNALSDFDIFKLVAKYWGCSDLFKDWTEPQAVFEFMKKTSKDMPCDITGMTDYDMVESHGGIQWPFPEGAQLNGNESRLFEDGRFYHADGKAKFLFSDPDPFPETPDKEYPYLLLTGRGSVAQWHTQTKTSKVEGLRKLYPAEVYIEMNPTDAKKLRIANDDWVTVTSRRGEVKARAAVSDTMTPGQFFMPMHYPETNKLTFPAFDPFSAQPSYKACAVAVKGG